MSKTDTDLRNVDTEKMTNPLREPSFTTDTDGGRRINVFDYETVRGMPFALAYKYEGYEPKTATNPVQTDDGKRLGPLPSADVLGKLHKRGKTDDGALNFWYNLNFDANIFLKDLADDEDEVLNELRVTNTVDTSIENPNGENIDVSILYYPKKILKISTDDGKHTSVHYDLAQFCYSGTLEDAADDWLDGERGKYELPIEVGGDDWNDSARNIDVDGALSYVGGAIEANVADVLEYAERDAQLTYDIAHTVVSLAEDTSPEIPFGRPVSTGYVAADFLRYHMESKPQPVDKNLQRSALKAYAGGRFEIFSRGRVEAPVAGPDINSAYPATFEKLPDLYDLQVGPVSAFSDPMARIRETYGDDYFDLKGYAFVKVRCTTDEARKIQPFAVKQNGRVEYPALQDSEVWTIGPILAHAVDEGIVTDYEIIDGHIAVPPEGETPRRAFSDNGVDIGALYAKRKALEADDDYRPAKLIKIVLNSMYGKTCQINPVRGFLEDYAEDDEDGPEIDPNDYDDADALLDALEADDSAMTADDLPNHVRPTGVVLSDGRQVVEGYEAGSMFNPAFAAYITGMTRLKLHASVTRYDLEDATLMFATDCLLVERDAFDGTPLADAADSDPDKTDSDAMRDALGGWDYDYEGDDGALLVASGVYEIYDSDATADDGEADGVLKTKARGFRKLLSDDYPTLRGCIAQPDEYLTDDHTGIQVENSRPRTFGEVVFRGKSARLIGEFIDDSRALSADMDGKRNWRTAPDYDDLSANRYDAPPKTVEGRTIDEDPNR